MTASRRDLVQEICFNVIIAAELTFYNEPYWISVLTVGAGELAVMVISYIFFILIKRNRVFMRAIKANQNLDCKF